MVFDDGVYPTKSLLSKAPENEGLRREGKS